MKKHILLCAFFLVSASINASIAPLSSPLRAVATFSILADFVKQVGREHVVVSIVGPNSDAHIYEPTPQDVRIVSAADIIFTNGFGFEGWLSRLIETSGCKGKIVVATEGIIPRLLNDPDEGVVEDPHAWHDVMYVKRYIQNIQKALSTIDPERRDIYASNAVAYLKELEDLNQEIIQQIEEIPPEARTIITAHDAFGYFGARYGINFLAPVGISTEAEPSVQDIVRLIQMIQAHNIKMIFVENISNPKMIHQIAEETGAFVGGVLYSDALSDTHEPGATYLNLMRHNVHLFVSSMRGGTPKSYREF